MFNPLDVLKLPSRVIVGKCGELVRALGNCQGDFAWVNGGGDYEVHTVWNAKDGTELKAWVMRADKPRGTIFFAHGFTRCAANHLGEGREARDGLHMCSVGWDARMHGNSGNGPLSFGYNESFDVEALVNKARELGLPRPYIIRGVSLGGMTARIAARRIPQVDGAIVIQAPASPGLAIDRAPYPLLHPLLRAVLENASGENTIEKGNPANCPLCPDACPLVLEVLGTEDHYGFAESQAAFETWPDCKAYNVNPGVPGEEDNRYFRLDLPGCPHPGTGGKSYWEYPEFHDFSAALIERVIREYAARVAANDPDLVWDFWREGDYYFSIGDYAKAIELYSKSAESGNEWGLFNVAKCHDYGLGVPLNKRKALEYYRRSAAMGNDWAAKYGGWMDAHEAYIRMTDGEPYDPSDASLREIREYAADQGRQFEEREDQGILRGDMHVDGAFITPPFTWEYGSNIFMAEGTYVNKCCHFDDSAPIYIGRNVIFGPGVRIVTSQDSPDGNGMKVAKPVVIEDNCWICGKVTIHPGVRIGAGAVVAAGSVVTEDVPANALVEGNPAKVERMIEQ